MRAISSLSLSAPRRAAAASVRAFSRSSAASAFAVRQPLPAWKADALLPDGSFSSLTNAWHAGKWAVLIFYPLDWTFVCPTEIIAFSDRAAEFEKIGAALAAVSVDSKFSHLAWTQQPRSKGGLGPMAIPLIADVTKAMSKSFGCLIEGDGDGDAGVALRATYIVDPAGVVRSVQVNDLPVGRSVDEVLRIIEAFQHVEKHGEVCPAGWKPGAAPMQADPKKSQEYFEATWGKK